MEYAVHNWHGRWICGDCAEKPPESLQPYLELLPNYRFLSFSVLNNPFPATVYAMPLCYVAQVDPVHIPA
jgi:hypothetical protein